MVTSLTTKTTSAIVLITAEPRATIVPVAKVAVKVDAKVDTEIADPATEARAMMARDGTLAEAVVVAAVAVDASAEIVAAETAIVAMTAAAITGVEAIEIADTAADKVVTVAHRDVKCPIAAATTVRKEMTAANVEIVTTGNGRSEIGHKVVMIEDPIADLTEAQIVDTIEIAVTHVLLSGISKRRVRARKDQSGRNVRRDKSDQRELSAQSVQPLQNGPHGNVKQSANET